MYSTLPQPPTQHADLKTCPKLSTAHLCDLPLQPPGHCRQHGEQGHEPSHGGLPIGACQTVMFEQVNGHTLLGLGISAASASQRSR